LQCFYFTHNHVFVGHRRVYRGLMYIVISILRSFQLRKSRAVVLSTFRCMILTTPFI